MQEHSSPPFAMSGPGGVYTPPTITVDDDEVEERTHSPLTEEPEPESKRSPIAAQTELLSAFRDTAPPNLAGLSPNRPSLDVESGGAELFAQGESLLSGGGGKAVTHRDYAFAILFYAGAGLCFTLFVIFYVFGLGAGSGRGMRGVLGKQVAGALVLSATIAFGIAVVWLTILNIAAKLLIKLSIVFAICALLCTSVLGFAKGWISVGLGMLGFVILLSVWIHKIWRRAELAATTIGVTVTFTSLYPAVYLVAAASLVAQAIWFWCWSKAATGTVMYFGSSSTSGQLLVVYLICMLFWGIQVLKNIVHVTTCGSFASWYFRYPQNPEASPTMNAFTKALTTSFGSIALGSLLVALVRGLRVSMSVFCKHWDKMPGCLAVPCRLCLKGIEKLTEYFNVYAFVNVAVYQRSYFDAAKHTCGIVKEAGVDALINDEFVDVALTMGAMCGGLVCGVFPALAGQTGGVLSDSQALAVMLLGSALGYTIIMAVLTVVWSCVVTLFVCFAEDALALYRTKPDVFHMLVNAWQQRLDVRLTLDESVMSASNESLPPPNVTHTISDCEAPTIEQHTSLLGTNKLSEKEARYS